MEREMLSFDELFNKCKSGTREEYCFDNKPLGKLVPDGAKTLEETAEESFFGLAAIEGMSKEQAKEFVDDEQFYDKFKKRLLFGKSIAFMDGADGAGRTSIHVSNKDNVNVISGALEGSIVKSFTPNDVTLKVKQLMLEKNPDARKTLMDEIEKGPVLSVIANNSSEKIFSICGDASGGRRRRSRKYLRKSYRSKSYRKKKSSRKMRRY
jgi:hypothetical protein